MLLSLARMRRSSLSPEYLRKQKPAKESAARSSRPRLREVITTLSVPQPPFGMVKHQATVTTVPQRLTPDEPIRKRDVVSVWFDRQVQRLRPSWCTQSKHRDSMFDGLVSDSRPVFEGDLRRASREANAEVLDLDGEPVPQHVIDHFFGEYPAGGSDWRNSAQWEEHLADYFPWKTIQTPPQKSRPPSEIPKNKDSYFPRLVWRTGYSRKRRQRGKLPEETTSDELDGRASTPSDEPLSQTPPTGLSPSHSYKSQRPKAGIVIRDGTARSAQGLSSIRCTLASESVNSPRTPIPWVPDLESAHSGDPDMNNPFDTARCPQETPPLDLLHFPLASSPVTQSVSQLRAEECVVSVSESGQLPSSPLCLPGSRVPSDNALLFKISPISSTGPSTTNFQHWPSQHPSALHDAAGPRREDKNGYIIAGVLSPTEDVDRTAMRKRSAPAVTATQHIPAPDPAMQFPPTPPDSRHASNASSSELSKHVSILIGPADRDQSMCELSDTTESSLPEYGISISLDDFKKSHATWWAGNTENHRHGTIAWQ